MHLASWGEKTESIERLTQVKNTAADGHFPETSELPPQDQEQIGWHNIAASVGPENGFSCFTGQG